MNHDSKRVQSNQWVKQREGGCNGEIWFLSFQIQAFHSLTFMAVTQYPSVLCTFPFCFSISVIREHLSSSKVHFVAVQTAPMHGLRSFRELIGPHDYPVSIEGKMRCNYGRLVLDLDLGSCKLGCKTGFQSKREKKIRTKQFLCLPFPFTLHQALFYPTSSVEVWLRRRTRAANPGQVNHGWGKVQNLHPTCVPYFGL